MATLAEVFVAVRPDISRFGLDLRKDLGKLDVSKATEKAGQRAGDGFADGFGRAAKRLALLATGALVSREVVQGLKGSVSAASDLGETTSKVGQIFGKSAKDIEAFASTADTRLGQSAKAALDANATFGIFGKSAGLQGKELTGFTTKLTTLASDLASFNNTSPEQAIAAIGAALRGESEPIRAYGVLLDDASLRQEALRQGLIQTTKQALTPQQKVLAAQALILKQTTVQQRDFARTSGGLANQQRIAAAQTEKLKVAIGSALLPVITQGATALNEKLLPPLIDLAQKHGPKVAAAIGDLSTKIGPFFKELGSGDAAPAFKSIAESAATLAPVVAELVLQLPSFTDLLNLGAKVMEFLADHTDDLAKAMPVLVGVIIAYKAAQLAANVAAAAAVPVRVAEVVVNRQLVRSNRELIASRVALTAGTSVSTAATAANTAATGVNTSMTIRQRVAAVASAGAQKAVAAATVVWTVAQKALNLALRANPIGIVITVLALLVGGLITAYKNSETFRKIVDSALRGVATAFGAMKDAGATALKFVVDKFLGFVETILTGAAKAFGWVPNLGDKLKTAATAFGKFRDDVNTRLGGIKDQSVNIRPVFDRSSMSPSEFARRAQGGAIRGSGGPKDDKAELSWLSNGEHVLTAADVRAMGGQAAVYRFRKTLRGAGHYARGGAVGFDVATDFPTGKTVASVMSQIANSVKSIGESFAAAIAKRLGSFDPSGRFGFPLPRGRYRVGVPLNGYPGHTGQDFPARVGTPVFAPFAGMFETRNLGNRSYGRYANLTAGGWRFIGAHLSGFARGSGAVSRGALIGYVGSSGNSTGPHLHAEFRRNGRVVNPRSVLSYDSGGMLQSGGLGGNVSGRPERVLSPSQTEAFERLVKVLEAGNGGLVHQHFPVQADPMAAASAAADRLAAALGV